jgi:hypothetical protein
MKSQERKRKYDLREKVLLKKEQNAGASVGIMNNQIVGWSDNRSLKGIDVNKKVKGIKRHIVVDKNGFMVTIAYIHDSKAAYLLARCLKELCCLIYFILADANYKWRSG